MPREVLSEQEIKAPKCRDDSPTCERIGEDLEDGKITSVGQADSTWEGCRDLWAWRKAHFVVRK